MLTMNCSRGGEELPPVVSTCDIVEGVVKVVLAGTAYLRNMQKVAALYYLNAFHFFDHVDALSAFSRSGSSASCVILTPRSPAARCRPSCLNT